MRPRLLRVRRPPGEVCGVCIAPHVEGSSTARQWPRVEHLGFDLLLSARGTPLAATGYVAVFPDGFRTRLPRGAVDPLLSQAENARGLGDVGRKSLQWFAGVIAMLGQLDPPSAHCVGWPG